MLNKKFNYREVKKFDVWYCKDRRILIYLGKNSGDVQSEGQYVWVWVGTMMAIETYDYNVQTGNYTYYPIDENWVKQNLSNHIEFLFSKINLDTPVNKGYNKSTVLNDLVLKYKGTPNIVSYIGNFKHPLLDKLEQRFTLPDTVEPKVERAELKVGYIYTKINSGYTEDYLYLGRRKCSIYSGYGMKEGIRKVHLYMFCNSSNLEKIPQAQREFTLKQELNGRIRTGYDGSFSINFARKDLREKCLGCKIDIDLEATWVLGSGGHIILPNGMLTQIM